MELDSIQIVAIATGVYALFSEIVGLNPKWKSNSVVQIILSIGKKLLPSKK